MTELLCHEDAYLREFDATVVEVAEDGVILDRTAFYPGGGGQPPDTGVLRADGIESRVKGLSRSGASLVHRTGSGGPVAGAAVRGLLDWGRRLDLMRTHTALHILCGVVWRDFGAQVTGGDMKPLSARMDFELEHMTADFAHDVEELINAEVAEARPVKARTLPREEAFMIPDLIRTKINLLPASIEEVRTVEIVGLDLQADGGIHVANTGEVGHIRVVKHESKGRINKRLRIAID